MSLRISIVESIDTSWSGKMSYQVINKSNLFGVCFPKELSDVATVWPRQFVF